MKNFEWDEKKRKSNLQKHGIDFLDVIEIFEDPCRIEAESFKKEETRYQTIGEIGGVIVLVVYTNRSEKKRIISARKASKDEREAYKEAKEDEG